MKTLKAKFIFWITLLFILMAVLIFVPLSIMFPEKISSQVLKRDIKIAQYLAREIQGPLLANNKLALKLLVEDRRDNLSDVIYIFIRGRDGGIITSTFKKGFPRGLLRINDPGQGPYSVTAFLSDGKKVHDIAVPLLLGELGSVHLGVSLESSKQEIAEFTRINYYVAAVVIFGLGTGIFIFALLGVFLSDRIVKLKDFAAGIGKGDLEKSIDLKTNDEIASLASCLNEMALHLREKIQEIKRLNTIEERNRIALDLHDGCAQELASIIKSIELCERLSGADPARALEELRVLRENVRGILNKTRQTIYDLKLPEDADFNLLDSINDYIKTYTGQNEITVELRVPAPLGALSPGRAKQIFYIIGEALINIKKHSHAKNVKLALERNGSGELAIDIKDDGTGFDIGGLGPSISSHSGLGLIGMRRRAALLGGTLVIDSRPDGGGTEVRARIPIEERTT